MPHWPASWVKHGGAKNKTSYVFEGKVLFLGNETYKFHL
jgi:hypothetical protein